MRRHVSPAALALLLDGALGSIGTEIIGNDGAGVLHVQEVGSQRALGRVGVMSALLALLLFLSGLSHITNGHDELSGGIVKRVEEISLAAALGGVLAKEQVGLANVVIGEGLEKLNNGAQTTNSLEKSC